MARSFLKLNTKRALSDGTYPIVICIGYGRDMYIPTGISSALEDWDKSTELYTGAKAKTVNAVLKNLLATTTARILELRESGLFPKLSNKQLKAMLQDPDAKEPPQEDVPTLADVFGMVMKTKAKRTAEIYASTLQRLRGYCRVDNVQFGDINKMWLDGFVASMSDLSTNTKSIHLRNLRAINNYAIDCGITNNYPFRRYKMPLQTSRKRSFSVDEIRRLASLDAGYNNIYRDIFLLSFYLIGINFVDLCHLDCIRDGRIEYRRAKTHKPYNIKVEPEALEIINLLKGETHLLYMLDNHKDYRSYYRQLRRGLEAVRKVYNAQYPDTPLKELTTYWARHTWATIASSLDIPKETIAAALGHDMGNRMTAIYIDYDMTKVDAANRKVIDYVLDKE